MKECAYCGRENEDAAVCCRECGTTEFEGDQAPSVVEKPAAAPIGLPPRATKGSPNEWVTIMEPKSQLESDILTGMLKESGIIFRLKEEYIPGMKHMKIALCIQVYGGDYDAAMELVRAV
jgi:hypothetical protein